MKYDEEKIGKIILQERTKRKMSQSELGEQIGVVGKQVSNYEKGKPIPPIDVLFKLCDVFQCELGYLLGEPDYSVGTKIETIITETTGLNVDTLNNIRRITGSEKSCLSFGYESTSYQSILNALLSSPQFLDFIECLHDLDSANNKSRNVFLNIENKVGKKRLDEAFLLYNSTVDYQHDPSALKLYPEQYDLLNMIDSGINAMHDLSYKIKIARYELHESFESLIESLYPRTKNKPILKSTT